MAGYQTGRLEKYPLKFQRVAEELFGLLNGRVLPSQMKKFPGSYSILGSSTQETAAKIIIYDPQIGKIPRQVDTPAIPKMDNKAAHPVQSPQKPAPLPLSAHFGFASNGCKEVAQVACEKWSVNSAPRMWFKTHSCGARNAQIRGRENYGQS